MLLDSIVKQSDMSLAPDGYSLGEIMGSGGMGVVYALQQENCAETGLVMKIIHPVLGLFEAAEVQLQHEAAIEIELRSLAHVVQTIGYHKHVKGHGYKIMRKMEGGSLKTWLREHPTELKVLDIPDNVRFKRVFRSLTQNFARMDLNLRLMLVMPIIRKLQQVVESVHEHGIIHGDLKPSNIYISEDLSVLTLFDFGLARRLSDKTRPYIIPFKAYTPLYASPAVLAGNLPEKTDDLYSIAAILWEMLFGRASLKTRILPFNLKHFKEVSRILNPLLSSVPSSVLFG